MLLTGSELNGFDLSLAAGLWIGLLLFERLVEKPRASDSWLSIRDELKGFLRTAIPLRNVAVSERIVECSRRVRLEIQEICMYDMVKKYVCMTW